MLSAIKNFCLLPPEVSTFEDTYLKRINQIALVIFIAHLPIYIFIAWLNETGPLLAALLTGFGLLGPAIAIRNFGCRRSASCVIGLTMTYMGSLLVHFAQGPLQIEMHFYYFVGFALLAVFGNPLVVLLGVVATAIHHTLFYLYLPTSVFNYEASWWVVGTHILFAATAGIGSMAIAKEFFNNVISLDNIIRSRTKQLELRNQDMRMILNSVREGLLTIDCNGRIQDERSKSVTDLLGKIEPDDTLGDVIARHDKEKGAWLQSAIEQLFEGVLPLEVCLDQLPKRVFIKGLALEIKYHPVLQNGQLNFLTVVIQDITSDLKRENLEAENHEMVEMISKISKDQNGFLLFFNEASRIVESLRGKQRNDDSHLKRELHTLKGSASIFGLNLLAEACHNLETQLLEKSVPKSQMCWKVLFRRWETAKENLQRLIDLRSSDIRLSDGQFNELLAGLVSNEPGSTLAPKLASWRLDATEDRLKTIGEKAKQLAKRMGKGNLRIMIQSNDLRVEPTVWNEFWIQLVHVIRNAIDHGFESAEERRECGKSDLGKLRLVTECNETEFVVTVEDDGRGINWDKVERLALEHGLPYEDENDLVNAIFSEGFSTTEEVSSISGRGIGMTSLKKFCEKLGGKIQVKSMIGQGTLFQFVFPITAMAPDTKKLLAAHGIQSSLNQVVGV